MIEGEAGIGKTALAEELLERVRATGAPAAARCYEEEQGLPYGPVADALRAVWQKDPSWTQEVAPHWLTEASRLVPQLGGAPRREERGDAPAAQSRFLEGVARCLAACCGSRPGGVLFLDDVHWADAGTVDALTFLFRRVEAPLCLLVTWRTEDVPPQDRLRRLLGEAEREQRGRSVALGRLTRADVAQLVQSTAPAASAMDPNMVDRLHEETEGVPYFIVEYLATIRAESAAPWEVPRTVRELVLVRVGASSELARQVLAAAAVIGRAFDFDTVREASGRTEEETVSALEELGRRALVTESAAEHGAPAYDFVHEKVRSVVYEETSLARRRILHKRVAEALTAGPSGAGEPALVAHHLRLAGLEPEAAEQFRLAGERAASFYANDEAREHFSTALALHHADAAALHEAIGDLDTLAGAYGDALTRYETAAALGNAERLAGIEHKLAEVHGRLGDWGAADSHLAAALAALGPGDAGAGAHVLADRSLVADRMGRADLARDLAQQALAGAEAAHDFGAVAQAHNILGILDKRDGDLDSALVHLKESLSVAEELADPGAKVAALNNLSSAMAARGDAATALQLAETALSLSRRRGDRHREAALHNNVADLLHAMGRSDDAMDHLKAAAAILAEVGEPGVMHPEVWKLVEW